MKKEIVLTMFIALLSGCFSDDGTPSKDRADADTKAYVYNASYQVLSAEDLVILGEKKKNQQG